MTQLSRAGIVANILLPTFGTIMTGRNKTLR
jgi:hypothetical protein